MAGSFLAAMGVCAKLRGIEVVTPIMGIPSIETGVFGGIIVGLIRSGSVQPFLQQDSASFLPGLFCLEAIGPDHHRLRSDHRRRGSELYLAPDRQWHQSVFELGGTRPTGARVHHLRRRRARAASIRAAPRLERAVLFPSRRFPRPDNRQRSSRRDHALYCRDPTAGNMTGGYLFKMWGCQRRRLRYGAARVRRTASKSAASCCRRH